MKPLILAAAVASSLATAAWSQTTPTVRVTAFDRPETQIHGEGAVTVPALQIVSSTVKADQPMPQVFSAYGKNISPPITWSTGPAATKGYVLIVQDIDAQDPSSRKAEPLLHWLAYNIPAPVHALNRAMKNSNAPASPLGMMQGWNSHDSFGYTGPHPPVGDAAHHYVFQIYAVDRKLGVGPGAHLDRVLNAMRGHVIARGELLATYAQPAPKPPIAPKTDTTAPSAT